MMKLKVDEIGDRFEKREDCYYDTETGLEWSLETQGPMPFESPCKSCYNGWRLPTIQELLSIFDYSRLSTDLPGMKMSHYWSSDIYAYDSNCVWGVYFYNGAVDYGTNTLHHYIRCVRGRPLQYHYI